MIIQDPGQEFLCPLCNKLFDPIGSHEVLITRTEIKIKFCNDCWLDMAHEYWAEYDTICGRKWYTGE